MRRVLLALSGVAVFAVCGLFYVSLRRGIAPLQHPPGAFSSKAIAHGEALAAGGHCASCHTRAGGAEFAGGYGVNTPFGIIYGSNITPDRETGIGLWSLDAFRRAMREGVSPDGGHLFPAFPYYAYTKLSDDDIDGLYAYLMSRPATHAAVLPNTLPFPLNVRAFQAGWKMLFFRSGRYRPDRARSPEWNRGAYLAEGLADCSGCHTPRSFLGGEETKTPYAGAVVDGWNAPPLTGANPAPITWTREELFQYLRTGASPLHGATGATMTAIVRDSLALPIVPDSDVRAIAAYFTESNDANLSAGVIEATTRQALATSPLGSGPEYDPDAALYASACLSCHYNSGSAPLSVRPELSLNTSLASSDPTNFIQVVLRGVGEADGAPGLVMPGFASSLSDGEVARIGAYLRQTRTKFPPWRDLGRKITTIRRTMAKSE